MCIELVSCAASSVHAWNRFQAWNWFRRCGELVLCAHGTGSAWVGAASSTHAGVQVQFRVHGCACAPSSSMRVGTGVHRHSPVLHMREDVASSVCGCKWSVLRKCTQFCPCTNSTCASVLHARALAPADASVEPHIGTRVALLGRARSPFWRARSTSAVHVCPLQACIVPL